MRERDSGRREAAGAKESMLIGFSVVIERFSYMTRELSIARLVQVLCRDVSM